MVTKVIPEGERDATWRTGPAPFSPTLRTRGTNFKGKQRYLGTEGWVPNLREPVRQSHASVPEAAALVPLSGDRVLMPALLMGHQYLQ